jgi:prefoldin subunit 5
MVNIHLQQAVPSEERRDGRSNGDLYFNFGLGYEVTKNVHEAVRYFNKALDEYRLERDNLTMEIETLSKMKIMSQCRKSLLIQPV